MARRTPMGSIRSPSGGTGSGAPDPIVFIKCINGWDPMAKYLCSNGLDGLSRDVNHKARVDIPPGK